MADLKSAKWIYAKALMFVMILVVSACLLILELPTLRTFFLVAMVSWSSARLYYFAFYVIERYVDPSFRFSGLYDFAQYLAGLKSDRQEESPFP